MALKSAMRSGSLHTSHSRSPVVIFYNCVPEISPDMRSFTHWSLSVILLLSPTWPWNQSGSGTGYNLTQQNVCNSNTIQCVFESDLFWTGTARKCSVNPVCICFADRWEGTDRLTDRQAGRQAGRQSQRQRTEQKIHAESASFALTQTHSYMS